MFQHWGCQRKGWTRALGVDKTLGEQQLLLRAPEQTLSFRVCNRESTKIPDLFGNPISNPSLRTEVNSSCRAQLMGFLPRGQLELQALCGIVPPELSV